VEQVKWIARFIEPLNQFDVPYMVTGSVACIVRAEPRVTVDVDIVIELIMEDIPEFQKLFDLESFYCPPMVLIQEAIRLPKGQFNIIDSETGMKADIFICKDDVLHTWGMSRRSQLQLGNMNMYVAPSEYVIIRKLEYFKEGGSSKHLRDIYGLVKIDESIDMNWLMKEIAERCLITEWEKVDP